MKSEQEGWMKLALEEARRGLGQTSPNPPVGALLVRGQRCLGKGYHRLAGCPHAEVEAMNSCQENIVGADLYVTLEPCSTHGKTPPCVDAIIAAGIGRVFYGVTDPNPSHGGRGLRLLEEAGVEVMGPVLEQECQELIRFFGHWVRTGRPYVIAKSGMTLDGRITPPQGESRWITGAAAREDVQRLRAQMDVILVGGETVRRDNPRLTVRGKYGEGRVQPLRVVVTRSGDLPAASELFQDTFAERTEVFHVEHLEPVLTELGSRGLTSVLLECGGRLMAEAFAHRLVNEVCFYLAPWIGGGSLRAVEGEGFRHRLTDWEIHRVGADLRIRAKVDYDEADFA